MSFLKCGQTGNLNYSYGQKKEENVTEITNEKKGNEGSKLCLVCNAICPEECDICPACGSKLN